MKTILVLCIGLLATATAAAGNIGIAHAPPSANDQSCAAQAIRLYPSSNQVRQRQRWAAACEADTSTCVLRTAPDTTVITCRR